MSDNVTLTGRDLSDKSKQKVNRQNEKDVHRSVKFLNKSSGGSDFNSQSSKCIYTNADSFLSKFDEFKQRYVSESEKPDIIAILYLENCNVL
jgi:hypothetical protein